MGSSSLLQWGHDKIVMEVASDTANKLRHSRLQWGHDKIVMEVGPSLRYIAVAQWLQWGHDKIVMEVSTRQRRHKMDGTASMGP